MGYKPEKGKTLLIPSGPAHDPDRKHLFVICTEACDQGTYLLVSICSIKDAMGGHYDQTCIIRAAAEHPFIKVDSYVEYERTDQAHGKHLAKLVDGKTCPEREACPAPLLDRIRKGLKDSRETPRWAKNHFDMIERQVARRKKVVLKPPAKRK